ncbi:MAG TPA: DUF4184 family protein [Acidimicrobiia bacterium]|jgi:hypothetical protein
MATVPFTLAHAAAGPPLWRLTGRRLVFSALVVGSMAPDFEYLLHLRTTRTIGHTLPGLVLMCLPASLLVLAVWHGVVKRPLATLVPARASHLAVAAHRAFSWTPAERFITICCSVLLGAWSHLTWDAFTHRNGLVVRHLDFLTHRVGVGHLHVYNVLQYTSGLLGMALLAVWYRRWAAQAAGQHPAPPPSLPVLPAGLRWTALVAAAAVIVSGGMAGVARALALGGGPRRVLVQGVLGTMAAAALAAVALAVVVETILQRRRP